MLPNAETKPIRPILRRVAYCLIGALTLVLMACAGAPSVKQRVLAQQQPLSVVVNKHHRRIEQFVDAAALSTLPRVRISSAQIAQGAYAKEISAAQAALVANHAARSLCQALAKYVELRPELEPDVLQARLVVTAIKPTNGAASGASFVAGQFNPVPFLPTRFPAGLGGLAMEGEIRDANDQQIVLMHWAQGASAGEDALVSAVGDAWQLAGRFGTDFARAMLDTDPKKRGIQRDRVSASTAKANRLWCAKSFGKLSVMGRGAGMLLPLAPAAIDSGAPPQKDQ